MKLLEKGGVVEFRQGLEHLAPAPRSARQDLGRHLYQVGGAVRLVAVGPLAHEIDIADGLLAAVVGRPADRHLAQHQLARRDGLQRRQHVAYAALCRVDLVDEEKMRNAVVLDVFHQRRERHDAVGRRLADDDGRVAHGERSKRVMLKFDRPRHVEKGPPVAEVVHRRHIDLGAHAALACLERPVADGSARAVEPRRPMAPVA